MEGWRTLQHVGVGVVGDGEDVRRHLCLSAPAVFAHDARRVDKQPLVRIHGHAEQTRVGLQIRVYPYSRVAQCIALFTELRE